jgi:AraC-like DNA-binding protein
MKRAIRFHNVFSSITQQRIDELCKFICENCDAQLGWEQLSQKSGFTHKELIALFQHYKQTTPMAFIKSARQLKKSNSPTFPQIQMFPRFIKNADQI